jgi:Meiotically Up-regulated Gene 113 (MUG113) protein
VIEAMTGTIESVYCFQLGDSDCFKVGRTKNSPEDRKNSFSTGSSEKFEHYRTIKTEYASELETYIHQLLDTSRAENGEFFHVSAQKLDLAVEDAQAFVEKAQPLIHQAERLRKEKPSNEVLVEPCNEMFQVYQRLRKVRRDRYLIEQEIAFLESKIQVAIGRNAAMREIASWKWTDHWALDIDRFKKEQDALYQQYKRNSGYRRFSLKRADLTKAA